MKAINSFTEIGSIKFGKEATKPDSSIVIRAIQGQTGGDMTGPEMMGHVLKRLGWNQYVFHRGCSFNLKSMLGAGLITGGREGLECRPYSILHSSKPMGGRN